MSTEERLPSGSADSERLNILIIGAGISGLSAALAIARLPSAQHRITVFEYSLDVYQVGMGVRLSVQAIGIISSLGLGPAFHEVAAEPTFVQFREYDSDRIIGEILQQHPSWHMHRPDMQRLLVEACEAKGVRIVFGKEVRFVDASAGKVICSDGDEEIVDLIILANGLKLGPGNTLPDSEHFRARALGRVCYAGVVSRQDMITYPQTADLIQDNSKVIVWEGPGVTILGYPMSAGSLYNVLLSTLGSGNDDAVGDWNQPGNAREVDAKVEHFCITARMLWSLVKDCREWTPGFLPALPKFVSPNGKFVIIGDAAGALSPYFAQGGCRALEDATSLAGCIQSVRGRSDLPAAMQRWDDLRQDRERAAQSEAAQSEAAQSEAEDSLAWLTPDGALTD